MSKIQHTLDFVFTALFCDEYEMDAFMHNWTNLQKFVLRWMELKCMAYCKFKKANEQNIELN